MSLYILLWFLFLINIRISQYNQILTYTLFIISWVLYSFRGIDVGIDTSAYLEIFSSISEIGYLSYLEPLWNVINIVVSSLGGNFNVLLAISGFLMLFPIFYAAKKFSAHPGLTLFIYYSMYLFCGSFNLTRQYLALSYILLAFCYFEQSKLKSLLSFFIAVGFHYSSFLFLPSLLFIQMHLNRQKAIVLLIGTFVIGTLFSSTVISVVLSFAYSGYGESDNLFRSDSTGIIFVLLMNVLYILMLLMSNNSILNSQWGKLYLMSAIILNLVYPLHYGTRIYNIFTIGNLFFYPLLLSNNRIQPKYWVTLCVIGFCAAVFFKMIIQNANEVYPYVFTIY